jgi:restriction system protein
MPAMAASERLLDEGLHPAGIAAWSTLSSGEFERRLGRAFQDRGFTVTGFGGNAAGTQADLGLAREGRRFLVQCRHWRKQQVSLAAVRDFDDLIAAHGACGGFLVAGGTFTREAREHALRSGIQLIDGAALEALLNGA